MISFRITCCILVFLTEYQISPATGSALDDFFSKLKSTKVGRSISEKIEAVKRGDVDIEHIVNKVVSHGLEVYKSSKSTTEKPTTIHPTSQFENTFTKELPVSRTTTLTTYETETTQAVTQTSSPAYSSTQSYSNNFHQIRDSENSSTQNSNFQSDTLKPILTKVIVTTIGTLVKKLIKDSVGTESSPEIAPVNTPPNEVEVPKENEHATVNILATLLKTGKHLELVSAILKPIQRGEISEEDILNLAIKGLEFAKDFKANENQLVSITTTPSTATAPKLLEGKDPNKYIFEVRITEGGAYINDTFIPREILNLIAGFKPKLGKYFAYRKTGNEISKDADTASVKEDDRGEVDEILKLLNEDPENYSRASFQHGFENIANSFLNETFFPLYAFSYFFIAVFKLTTSNNI